MRLALVRGSMGVVSLTLAAIGCGASPAPAKAPRVFSGVATRMGVVSGFVVDDETGAPIANAQITVGGVATRARPDGSFEATVPAGRARVQVADDSFLPTVREVAVGGVTLSLPFKLARKEPPRPVGRTGGTLSFRDATLTIPAGAFGDGSTVALTYLGRARVASIASRPQFIDSDGAPRRAVATVDFDASQAPATAVRVRVPVPADASMDSVRGFVIDEQGQWTMGIAPLAVSDGGADFAISGKSRFGVAIDARKADGKNVGYLVAEAGDMAMNPGDVVMGGNEVDTASRAVAIVDPQGSRIELGAATRAHVEAPTGESPPAGSAAFAGSATITQGRARVVVPPALTTSALIKLTLATPALTLAVHGTAFDVSSCEAGAGFVDVLEVVEGSVDVTFGGRTTAITSGQSSTYCTSCAANAAPMCAAPDDGGQPPPPDAQPLAPDAMTIAADAAPSTDGPTPPDAAAPEAALPPTDAPAPPDAAVPPADVPLPPVDAMIAPDLALPPPPDAAAPLDMPIAVVDDAAIVALDSAVAELDINPSNYDYGSVPLQTASALIDYKVTNLGAADTGLLDAQVSSTEFFIVADACTGQALAPQASCVVTVKLFPSTLGAKSALLTVQGTPGGTAMAMLTGLAVAAPKLDVVPPSYDFGPWAPGQMSSNVTLTVTNNGGSPTGPPTVTVTGKDSGVFSVLANSCTNMLAPSDYCQIIIAFVPPIAVGPKAAQLELYGNPGNNVIVPLNGNASYVDVTPKMYDFGTVAVGANALTKDFTVQNIGGTGGPGVTIAPTVSSSVGNDFTITGSTCSANGLQPGQACTVTVAFQPRTAGAKSVMLDVAGMLTSGGAAGTDHVVLSGTAN